MKKKILLALAGLPSKGNHGGAQTCLGIIFGLKEKYDVEILSFMEENLYSDDKLQNEKFLNDNNIKINYINIPNIDQNKLTKFQVIRNFFRPNIKSWYKWENYTHQANETLNKIKPDIILCYHYEPLSALYKCNYRIIALMGDPTQELFKNSFLSKKKENLFVKIIKKLQYLIIKSILDRIFILLTEKCEKVFFFSSQYTNWSNELGVKSYYLRTPLYDNFEENRNSENQFTILMIGDLTGTVTKTGLDLFFEKILPDLNIIIGKDNFQVKIVGRNNLFYKNKYSNFDNVQFLGKVEPANKLFLNSDVLLTPNPLGIGIRVRILTAFAYGCPVVTHNSNTKGIPELEHDYNALISDNSKGLVNCLLRLYKDEKLKTAISLNGKDTFKSFFSHKILLKNFIFE